MRIGSSRVLLLGALVGVLILRTNAFQLPLRRYNGKRNQGSMVSPKVARTSLKMKGDSDDDKLLHKFRRTSNVLVAGVLLSLTTFCGLPQPTLADDVSFDTSTTITPVSSQTAANVRAGLSARRYWTIMASTEEGADETRREANEALMDYAVGTVNNMYYDNTGGVRFNQRDFYNRWRELRDEARQASTGSYHKDAATPSLATRDGVVQNLKWIVSTLNDPYSKYLTREELWQELNTRNDGFLGTGAVVEPPELGDQFFARGASPTLATVLPDDTTPNSKKESGPIYHSAAHVQNLPVVTAVAPDSPAERSGITVGDRIVAVGEYSFLGQSKQEVTRNFERRFVSDTTYFGHSELTLAKPVLRTLVSQSDELQPVSSTARTQSSSNREREVVIGYRQTRVRMPTKSLEEDQFSTTSSQTNVASQNFGDTAAATPQQAEPTLPPTKGGNAIVHWELLSEGRSSIFQRSIVSNNDGHEEAAAQKVGYIRLTRFSKASTAGYIEAVRALEDAGATSYIIDVRNNYGGIIQEAMLTASTLLRDPHAVLCYTMNARGGFTPHDVEEYVVDKRYPGYLLSREPRWVTLIQAQRENPDMFGDHWVPPSSYASLREQTATRGLHRPSTAAAYGPIAGDMEASVSPYWLQWSTAAASENNHNQQWLAQRNLVILVNEGTASSAEVFASSLHDNGRTLALIGSKTYGKGLIQHTFPMPDGGGLRLTVAEYLTPALRHVTVVGNAKYDRVTGEQVGGGIKPDLYCASKQGIPANVGADLCVGMALDVLQEAEPTWHDSQGQEKHHRQQKMKQRQEQQDLLKHGILAQGTTHDGKSEKDALTSAGSSSVVAAQQEDAKVDPHIQDDF